MASAFQLLLRGLDGRTSCLQLPSDTITGSFLQHHISSLFRIPPQYLLLVSGSRVLTPSSSLSALPNGFFPSCTLLLRLRGGKGGFGSLLRGAATKAGQKKTSNFDACRDMSGRRLRHVNAEKKLKEWKAQAKDRELEKAANEYLKKQAKRKKNDAGCSKEIEKYREATCKTMEDVESAVATGLAEAKKFGKRKIMEDDLPSSSIKRTHLWFSDGDTGVSESENEDSNDELDKEVSEDHNAEEEPEKENAKETSEVVSDFRSVKPPAQRESDSEGALEQRKPIVPKEGFYETFADVESNDKDVGEGTTNDSDNFFVESEHGDEDKIVSQADYTQLENTVEVHQLPNPSGGVQCQVNGEINGSKNMDNGSFEKLNFDNFSCSSELEVLGLERLKHELQSRGLKCGGNLADRAARLFLLKTTPLEKLDKKYLAKSKA